MLFKAVPISRSCRKKKNILEKEDTEKRPDRDAALIEKSQEHEDNTCQEREQEIQYEKSLEERRRKKKMMTVSGQR